MPCKAGGFMVSLYLTCSAEQPLCFEKLTLPMGKNKKSFFHGVHKKKRQFSLESCRFFLYCSLLSFCSSLFTKIVVSGEKLKEKR
jgi:hypothetical protein